MTTLLQNFGWLDALDIVIVAFIIYRVILIIKGNMVARILFGLAIVLFLHAVSRFLDLQTLRLLLDNLLGSTILILVIIFQSDIRRALMAFGRIRFARGLSDEEESEVIAELVNAAEALAGKKIGALIVIERDMGVDDYLEVGTEIDAKVTSELITSIFLPYSPIHDGAVLIQRGKLTKAGCFLPLTQNPEISKTLGTRHRAAIGLTEVVDAVVIVVSEETGKISAVVGGRITRDLDANTLRKVLKRLLSPKHYRWGL